MKSFKTTHFLEKGYGHFPYIIVRIRSGLYKQIPIHRRIRELMGFEGVFVTYEEDLSVHNYEEMCKKLFRQYWRHHLDKGSPVDACLVMNSREGYYLSKEGEVTTGPIPSGGWLYSVNEELIEMEGAEHYIFRL
ncbi:hypothetical protein ACFLR9_09360 [Bacteroidota bacterium]